MSTGRHHNDDSHLTPRTNTETGPDTGTGPDVDTGAEEGVDTAVVVALTPRGAAALEELADALTADVIAALPADPAGLDGASVPAIEALLGRVMSADVEDLAAGLTAVDLVQSSDRDWLHGDMADRRLERLDKDVRFLDMPPGSAPGGGTTAASRSTAGVTDPEGTGEAVAIEEISAAAQRRLGRGQTATTHRSPAPGDLPDPGRTSPTR